MKSPKVVALAVVAGLVLVSAALVTKGLSAPEHVVRVHEVLVDRQNRAFVDIVFSRPVAGDHIGEVVLDPPASVFPLINGVWRWTNGNILRFQPAGRFPIASQYKLTVAPEKIGTAEVPFAGEREFVIKTDDFTVRHVTWGELPSANGLVILQGEASFNYRVDPASLAPRIHLRDGALKNGKVELITSYESESISWRTSPLRKEKQQREVVLVIDKDLFPVEGNVTLGADFVQTMTIGSNERLAVRNVTPNAAERETTIRVEFSSAVTADALRDKLSVVPDVKYRIETEGNYIVLAGKFQPGKSYDLTIAEGLVAVDSALLSDEFRQAVAIPDLEPLLAFQSEGMFLSASGRRNVAVDAINTPTGRLVIDRVYRNNLFFYLQAAGYSYGMRDEDGSDEPYYRAYYDSRPVEHHFGDRIVEKPLTFSATPNVRSTSTIPIGSLVRSSSPGLYKVSVFRGEDDWHASTRWILITDLGIVAKRSEGEIVIWVASFKDLTPIANAAVSLIDDQNQTLARGRTDDKGFWTARGIAGKTKGKATPFMITVEQGKDFSFLLLGDSRVDLSPFDVTGATLPASGYSAFLYGERTLYRPGETLRGVASVRTTDLRYPPQMPLVLQHIDPTGEQRSSTRLTADASGMATYDIPLPAYSRTGRHTLNLLVGDTVIGSTPFHVEEFVPDRIKVEISPSEGRAQSAEGRSETPVLKFGVTSAYLFGAPASSLAVETRVRLVPSVFGARGYEDFTFQSPSRKFDPRELAVDNGTLDDEGRKQYSIAIPEKLAVPSSLDAVITSRVQEQGGRGVAATTRVPVHPYPYYIGVHELPREGDGPRRFEWVALSTDGKEMPSAPMRAEIYEERWHTVLRQTSNGGYSYESTHDSEQLRTIPIPSGKTRGVIPFRTGDWGSYRIVITDPVSLAATELTFDAWSGNGYSPWAMKNPGRLELTLDKPAYHSGTSATVTIKSPFAGKALITVERDKVLYTSVVTLASNSARVEVPLHAAARPNAYITATVVRAANDLEPGEAGRAFGAIRVDVDRAENELRPEIRVIEEMRSARALKVVVKTTPHARVTIAAVDQGILQLVSEKRPDPFAYFYQHRALEVITHDIFALLLPEIAAKNKAIAGGSESGEGVSQYLRTDGMRRAKPVSFWSGVLTADDDGIAKVAFDIPDFQGAVRVTAVVHAQDQYGSSDTLVRVHDPIVLMPTVPRFVSTSDRFSLPVTIRNDTPKNGTFEVTANITGNASLTADGTQRVAIERNREATVLFALRASSNRGGIALSFHATGNGERGVAAATIPVFPSLPDATDELIGTVDGDSMTLPSPAPGRFQEGSMRRDVIISPLPILQLRARLDYLVQYPYGCVEQTTSTAFPMIYLGELAAELDPESFRKRPAAAYVREAIRRLGTMQTASGGFAMWPYGSDVNVWGSIYATHFLTEAKRAGHGVDTLRYNRALEFLQQLAKARPEYDRWGLQQSVYALYVLARAQRADLGTMDYIREKHADALTFESRALLGAAYGAVGNPSAVTAMLTDIETKEDVARQTGSNYNSTLRNRALVVLALLDAAPNDPRLPRLADRLAREVLSASYYTTQESAMALLALGQFFQMRKANATYKGTLLHDGKVVGTFDGKTTRFSKLPSTGTLTVQMEKGYAPDAAYFTVRVRGTPAESTFHASTDGIRLTRTFMDRNGTPLAANDMKQGEIVVIRTEVESTSGPMENVVIQVPLPGGLEVENPRLSTTESLPWIQSIATSQHDDIRDDRVLFFVDLGDSKLAFYTVARAITPGEFRLPPAQAEAMYAPGFRATEGLGRFRVSREGVSP